MSLYTVYNSSEPLPPRSRASARFHCAKHEPNLPEIEAQHYEILYYKRNNHFRCNCPGYVNYGYCRHQEITKLFAKEKKINTGRLYDFDKQRWTNYTVYVPPAE
jgi:hypothetical protein